MKRNLGGNFVKVLVKKDFTVAIKMILFSLLGFSFWFGALAHMMEGSFPAQSLYMSIVLLATLIIINDIANQDSKYNTDIIFNSLPIDRKTIVMSKYLSMGVLPFIYGGATFVFSRAFLLSDSLMFLFTPRNIFNLEAAILAIAGSFIVLSLYLPLYYLSIDKAKIASSSSLFIVFLAPILLIKFSDIIGERWIINNISLSIGALVISLVLFYISLNLSIKIYNKREF